MLRFPPPGRRPPWSAIPLALVLSTLVTPLLVPIARPCAFLVAVATAARSAGPGAGMLLAAAAVLPIRLLLMAPPLSLHVTPVQAVGLAALLIASWPVDRLAAAGRLGRRVEAWARRLTEATGEGLWLVSPAGRTLFANRAMAALLGYRAEELIGGEARDLTVEGTFPAHLLAVAREGPGDGGRAEVRLRHRDGSKRWARLAATPAPAEPGWAGAVMLSVRDVTALRRAQGQRDAAVRARRASEARVGRLIDSDILGVVTAELGGAIIEANGAFLRMTGHTDAQVRSGQVLWTDMTPPEFAEADRRAIGELWARGACTPYEKELLCADGGRVPVLIGMASLGRYPRQWIGFALDLTERKKAEEALARAKEEAEAAGRAKDRFLAVLSHELRTPLTPILAMATALLDDPETPAEFRPMLEMTRRNVELEARLIDDLLDVTRIGRGRLRMDRRVVDAHELVRRAAEICDEEVRSAGLRLELDLAAPAHHVEADPARVQQVVWNLIRNACKFTPTGGRVAIRTGNRPGATTEGAGPRLDIEVIDTGIGVAPEDLARIFEPFEQGAARRGGLGLGLAIGRAVAEAHGGTLTARSEGPGRGACFTLELATVPAPPAPAPERPADPGASDANGRPLEILLVEDNPDILRYLARVLGMRRHAVRTADSVAAALDRYAEGGVDLLISDIELPDGTGLELMDRLGRGGPLVGIALSGFGSEEDVAQSRAAGFAAHLTKPVDVRALEAAIQQVVARN